MINLCAVTAMMFSINKNSIHPDISYDEPKESAKMVMHTTCQHVGEKIFSEFGMNQWERYGK